MFLVISHCQKQSHNLFISWESIQIPSGGQKLICLRWGTDPGHSHIHSCSALILNEHSVPPHQTLLQPLLCAHGLCKSFSLQCWVLICEEMPVSVSFSILSVSCQNEVTKPIIGFQVLPQANFLATKSGGSALISSAEPPCLCQTHHSRYYGVGLVHHSSLHGRQVPI